METIGHHTCNKSGGKEYVLENAPFLSVKDETGKISFLGEGFYFWDYNLEMAKYWGKVHYWGEYYIFETDLSLKDGFLDLAGNRKDMIYFNKLLDRFKRNGIKVEDWKIGAFIEFLKIITKTDNNIFPYNVIRAEDYQSGKDTMKYYFSNNLNSYTILRAKFIICFFKTTDIPLHLKRIVYES